MGDDLPMTFKPMLAAKLDPKHPIKFPVLASPKIDGVRAVVRDGVVLSRSLKPIPNKSVQELFGRPELEGLDGELVVGKPTGNDVMQRTTSGVMSIEGTPDVTFYVFDDSSHPDSRFGDRLDLAACKVETARLVGLTGVVLVKHMLLLNETELNHTEDNHLADGYEGVMVRSPTGGYKHGRSTAKEGGLIKVKRFEDSEATVIGVEERMHNGNEATVNELGRTKRSTHQANKTGRGDLGALVCRTPEGVEFNIGTGFSDGDRQALWAVQRELPGKLVKYRHFAVAGVKEAPRFPVFVGFRSSFDL